MLRLPVRAYTTNVDNRRGWNSSWTGSECMDGRMEELPKQLCRRKIWMDGRMTSELIRFSREESIQINVPCGVVDRGDECTECLHT